MPESTRPTLAVILVSTFCPSAFSSFCLFWRWQRASQHTFAPSRRLNGGTIFCRPISGDPSPTSRYPLLLSVISRSSSTFEPSCLQKNPDMISGNMTTAMILYSSVIMRFSLRVTPRNLLLFANHLTNFTAQWVQVCKNAVFSCRSDDSFSEPQRSSYCRRSHGEVLQGASTAT